IAPNYAYYLPRTEHGSSLSACMYALNACKLGLADQAYPLFMKSARADLEDGGKQWAGLVYIGGTHPAAAGGAYMTLLWGFLGMSLQADALRFSPRLPSHWQSVTARFSRNGKRYEVNATQTGVTCREMV
ncbi:MAG: glycoside hydrolase family 65 protein, partial [Firmicutes bacterium]|nr:glycoside hydrolase family 65 protein [Bacillota bacterium]